MTQFCSAPGDSTHTELVTGKVFTAPEDILDSRPGTLMLTDCIDLCLANSTCRSANFETGLCVLFSSSAQQYPGNVINWMQSIIPYILLYLSPVHCIYKTQTLYLMHYFSCQAAWPPPSSRCSLFMSRSSVCPQPPAAGPGHSSQSRASWSLRTSRSAAASQPARTAWRCAGRRGSSPAGESAMALR